MKRWHISGSRGRHIVSGMLAFAGGEQGDDLIEYALLTTFIGLLGMVAMGWLHTAIFNVYSGWDAYQQAIYAPPNPM